MLHWRISPHLYLISISLFILPIHAVDSLTAPPYDTQVRLIDGAYPSSGILEVYLNNQWGTVCYDEFTSSAADTACRQLGYTNSNNKDGVHYSWVLKCLCLYVYCMSLNCNQSSLFSVVVFHLIFVAPPVYIMVRRCIWQVYHLRPRSEDVCSRYISEPKVRVISIANILYESKSIQARGSVGHPIWVDIH